MATADRIPSTVTIFDVTLSGLLIQIGAFSTGVLPESVAFSPGGNFLATANFNGDTVSMFCVNNNRNLFVEALFEKYQKVCDIQ